MSSGTMRAAVVTYDELGDPVRVTKFFVLPEDWTGPDVMDRLDDPDTTRFSDCEEVYVAVIDEDHNEITGSDL